MRNAAIVLCCATLAFLGTGCSDLGEPVGETGLVGTDGVEYREVRPYTYTGYDSGGAVLITGRLNLVFSDTPEVSGTWDLAAAPGVPTQGLGPQVGKGLLTGRLEGSAIGLNLNPNFVDNNVVLTGTLSSQKIEGRWDYVGFPGIIRRGAFVAQLTASVRQATPR